MTALPEGFIPHEGGPCPVQGLIGIHVIIRAGLRGMVLPQAVGWKWGKGSPLGEIIAYLPPNQGARP